MNNIEAREEAEKIWNKLISFSKYGFNKSHSAAYSIMSYWCQWFKCYYPLEFYTTSLNYSKSEAIPGIINEIRKRDLEIVLNPPDINNSKRKFTCDNQTKTIYWSLTSIKGIGDAIVTNITLERKNGKFQSVLDFAVRMKGKGCGKDKIETLILAGAFDNIHGLTEEYERKDLLEELYEFNKEKISEEKKELFSRKYNFVRIQKDLTGFGIIDFVRMIKSLNKQMSGQYVSSDDFIELERHSRVTVAGELISLIKRFPKKKDKTREFASIKILSNYGVIPATIWSDVFGKNKDLLEEIKNKKLLFAMSGKVKFDDYSGQNTLYSDVNVTKIIKL